MLVARLTLLFTTALVVCSAHTSPSLDDEKELRRIKEVEWPQAYREQDPQLLDRILASEFQMIDADGVWSSKAEELDYVREHKPSYESFRFVIKRLEIFDERCAVVAGAGFISNRQGAHLAVTEYQSTNIFIKREGRWQAIASHVSGVKDQRPSDNSALR